jgi:hypothetical protein
MSLEVGARFQKPPGGNADLPVGSTIEYFAGCSQRRPRALLRRAGARVVKPALLAGGLRAASRSERSKKLSGKATSGSRAGQSEPVMATVWSPVYFLKQHD